MRRSRTHVGLMNLSMVIPVHAHYRAKAAYLQSGAPTFAAFIAWLLERAPMEFTASDICAMYAQQCLLTACREAK